MSGWTAQDVPDQAGRTVVVTGANSGIGFHAARVLAERGADVVLAVRDTSRGEDAAGRIRSAASAAQVEVRRLDLADLASVREFAAGVAERFGDGLDLLVNNAGVMALPYRRTADGFEMQFGTNHLGHFALTGLLLESLSRRPDPRVVTVSSGLHRRGAIDFDDLQGERSYDKWRRIFFTGLMNRIVAQSAEKGAEPTLMAATSPDLPGGAYVGPGGPGEMRGHPKIVSSSDRSHDEETARRLWEVSEELTGVSYDRLA